MAGMVAHAELTLHHLRHSLPGPHLAKKSKRLCSSIKQTGQLRQLLGVQLGLRSRGWMATQRLFSLCPGSFEPLARCLSASTLVATVPTLAADDLLSNHVVLVLSSSLHFILFTSLCEGQ